MWCNLKFYKVIGNKRQRKITATLQSTNHMILNILGFKPFNLFDCVGTYVSSKQGEGPTTTIIYSENWDLISQELLLNKNKNKIVILLLLNWYFYWIVFLEAAFSVETIVFSDFQIRMNLMRSFVEIWEQTVPQSIVNSRCDKNEGPF